MKRRAFVHACAGTFLATCAGARAAPPGRFRVVIRMPGTAENQRDFGFVMSERLGEQLAKFGYLEGSNLVLVNQYLGESNLVSDAQLAEIRADKTDAIVSFGVQPTIPLRNVFRDIPIVAWGIEDPVAFGLAESFTRPGGNVTGLTQGKAAVYPKQVDFLAKMVRGLGGIAVMGARIPDPPDDAYRQYRVLLAAIRAKRLKLLEVPGTGRRAFEALAALNRQGIQAAIYFDNPYPLSRETQKHHAAEAIRQRIAILGYFANLADDGFLASYGELDSDLFRRLAQQLDLVLRGAKPAQLPFMEPQRFHLRVNRTTASALGLAIPSDVLIAADELIG